MDGSKIHAHMAQLFVIIHRKFLYNELYYGLHLLNIEKIITPQGEKKNEKDEQNFKLCYGNSSHMPVCDIGLGGRYHC